MARPKKAGMDYFPLDVDFFDDEKIVALEGEHGMAGELVAVKLLCAIYRKGYYMEWTEMVRYKLLRSLRGVDAEKLDAIVAAMVRWQIFDREMFDRHGVLTSRGIQERYFYSTKKRLPDMSALPFVLIAPEEKPKADATTRPDSPDSPDRSVDVSDAKTPLNSPETPVNSTETPLNSPETPQSKVKESIVKENKVKPNQTTVEGEKKKEESATRGYAATIAQEVAQMGADTAWCRSLASLHSLTPEKVVEYLSLFEAETCGTAHKSYGDARSHFARWLRLMVARSASRSGTHTPSSPDNSLEARRQARREREQRERMDEMQKAGKRQTADDYLRSRGYAAGTSIADIIRSQLAEEGSSLAV